MAPKLVVVGASRGGLRALQVLLAGLPRDFPVPVVIAQHRHPSSDASFIALLSQHSAVQVGEAQDKDALEAGRGYVAPPDYHLLVEDAGLALSTEAPVNHSRPSVDVLFESAAHAFGHGVVAVVLTGSTPDGARGAAAVKACGGVVIVQDPGTAESSVMPAAAIDAAQPDRVLPLEEVAPCLVELCGSKGS